MLSNETHSPPLALRPSSNLVSGTYKFRALARLLASV